MLILQVDDNLRHYVWYIWEQGREPTFLHVFRGRVQRGYNTLYLSPLRAIVLVVTIPVAATKALKDSSDANLVGFIVTTVLQSAVVSVASRQ